MEIHEGDLLAIQIAADKFAIIKLLKIDDIGFHIRWYKNSFSEPPRNLDGVTLELGKWDDSEGFSIGHMPVLKEAVYQANPHYVETQPVTEEELEGYAMWLEDSGGYFSSLI